MRQKGASATPVRAAPARRHLALKRKDDAAEVPEELDGEERPAAADRPEVGGRDLVERAVLRYIFPMCTRTVQRDETRRRTVSVYRPWLQPLGHPHQPTKGRVVNQRLCSGPGPDISGPGLGI